MKLMLNANQYVETAHGTDLSIPVKSGTDNVNAWYCDPVKIEPVVAGNFIGEISSGAPVNFRNITLNPHGNGTHTECVGHIAAEPFTINQCLKEFHFMAELITVRPEKTWNKKYKQEDECITAVQVSDATKDIGGAQALIIRTLDNSELKKKKDYSGANPPYFTQEAMSAVNDLGIDHLLVDLPSVDREQDEGALVAHKTFWNYPNNPQAHKTISELLYIPDALPDGSYFINIQIMSLENDASPSKIMAYPIHKTNPA